MLIHAMVMISALIVRIVSYLVTVKSFNKAIPPKKESIFIEVLTLNTRALKYFQDNLLQA